MHSTRRGVLLLAAFASFAVAVHMAAGTAFPVPWVDEIDFLTPAHSLARHGTLAVPSLSANRGMFWVSDLYYFLLAPVLRFLPATIAVGRTVSLLAILTAGLGFWTASRKAGTPPVVASVLVGAWLLAPKVVIAGNITRHEAVVLAVVAWGLVAVVSGRRVAGLVAGAFAFAMHPAGALFALVLGCAALLLPAKRTTRWEWAGLAALGGFAAFEAVHFLSNWDVASAQIRFQLQRKAGRTTPARDRWFVAGFLISLCGVAWRWPLPYRRAAAFGGCAMAGAVISAYGHEMWYGVYGLPTGLLLVALGATIAAPHTRWVSASSFQLAAAGAAVVITFSAVNFTESFYDMRIGDDTTEWTAFVRRVETQLVQLDRSASAPTTVALNPMSDLPWPAAAIGLEHVELVKETPVTSTTDATYQLVCCRDNVVPAHPVGEVVATVVSPQGEFNARLVKISRPVRSASS